MSQQQQIEEHPVTTTSHTHRFQICCALVCQGPKVIMCIYIYIYDKLSMPGCFWWEIVIDIYRYLCIHICIYIYIYKDTSEYA